MSDLRWYAWIVWPKRLTSFVNMWSCTKYKPSCMSKCYRKTTLLKMFGQQIWLCLMRGWSITWTQWNSLTLNDTFTCLGNLEVTHQKAVKSSWIRFQALARIVTLAFSFDFCFYVLFKTHNIRYKRLKLLLQY